MNKRMRMKRQQAERKKIHKILDLALEKNRGIPTVFLEFSGHVNWLEVSIYETGLDYGYCVGAKHCVYLDERYSPSTTDRVIAELEAL